MLSAALEAEAHRAVRSRDPEVAHQAREFTGALIERHHHIIKAITAARHDLLQPGLFDRRVERTQTTAQTTEDQALDEIANRIEMHRLTGSVSTATARLLLILNA
jgi:hypothetical protein